MSNVLIVYGSTTGNTADIAEYLGGRLRAAGHVADVRDAADVSPDGLCEGRDVALFGCSAWGTDEVELQTISSRCSKPLIVLESRASRPRALRAGTAPLSIFAGRWM